MWLSRKRRKLSRRWSSRRSGKCSTSLMNGEQMKMMSKEGCCIMVLFVAFWVWYLMIVFLFLLLFLYLFVYLSFIFTHKVTSGIYSHLLLVICYLVFFVFYMCKKESFHIQILFTLEIIVFDSVVNHRGKSYWHLSHKSSVVWVNTSAIHQIIFHRVGIASLCSFYKLWQLSKWYYQGQM